MQHAVPAWEQAAVSLRAVFERATMALRCSVDGQSATIATRWEAGGEARHTEITLKPEPALGIRRSLEWSEAEGVLEGDLGDLPRRACEVFVELERDCKALTIAPDRVVALLPAPLEDPAPARSALLAMVELADALRARAGAYR
jgi:hypothetical protein